MPSLRIAGIVYALFLAWSGCGEVAKSTPDASSASDASGASDANTLPHICAFDTDVFDSTCTFGE